MPEEAFDESLDESDEAYWESDEAFAEADESVEDLGEARQRSGRGSRNSSRYRPGRGVRGMTMRDPNGRPRNVAFPARLATAAETNRGLANQEVGRRALEERLERLEARNRKQLKNGAAITGMVTLLLGGGLTAISLFKAQQATGGSLAHRWAEQETAEMATLSSVSQLATTGAKMLVDGRYPRSGVGIAADAFAVLQIAGYTLASLQPQSSSSMPRFTTVAGTEALNAAAMSPGAAIGDHIYDTVGKAWYVLARDFNNGHLAPIPMPIAAA
jgi:hypothetical protein